MNTDRGGVAIDREMERFQKMVVQVREDKLVQRRLMISTFGSLKHALASLITTRMVINLTGESWIDLLESLIDLLPDFGARENNLAADEDE